MLVPLDRRGFLRTVGASLAAPLLAQVPTAPARRLVCVGNPFGMHAPAFFPAEAGAGYALSPLLEPLARHREHFTVFSHLDHAVDGGHAGARAFLSGARPIHAAAMPERNVTLDQKAAEHLGAHTRLPVLNLCADGTWEMCWSRSGVHVRPLGEPRQVFDLLFAPVSEAAVAQRAVHLDQDADVLEAVDAQTRAYARRQGAGRRARLDEMSAAIDDVRARLARAQAWLYEPRPEVSAPRPTRVRSDVELGLMFDLVALALETDSTRVATLEIGGGRLATALGLRGSYHRYSHHGLRPEAIEHLLTIERFQMQQLARFLDRLRATADPLNGGTLLDHTLVLFGSGLGNGNAHSCRDLPVLVAGGGLPHGRHLVLPEAEGRRVPLCNLYLSLLRHLGLDLERFGTSTGPLEELAG
jgi:hypothetical protein